MSVINLLYLRTMEAHVQHRCMSLKMRESFGILLWIWVDNVLLVQVGQHLRWPEHNQSTQRQAESKAQVYTWDRRLFSSSNPAFGDCSLVYPTVEWGCCYSRNELLHRLEVLDTLLYMFSAGAITAPVCRYVQPNFVTACIIGPRPNISILVSG